MKRLVGILVFGLVAALATPLYAGVMSDGSYTTSIFGQWNYKYRVDFNASHDTTQILQNFDSSGDYNQKQLEDRGPTAYAPECSFDNNECPPPAESPAPVPEPATLLLLGSGLIGLAGMRKKNSK